MIKRRISLALLFLCLCMACKSTAPENGSPAETALREDGETAGTGDGEQDPGLWEEESPAAETVPREPETELALENIAEPDADLPEPELQKPAPEERDIQVPLPEPELPVTESPAETLPAPAPPPQEAPLLPPPAGESGAPEQTVLPAPSEPETPPSFMRPAEEDLREPIVREPVPVPARPLPEPPPLMEPVREAPEAGPVYSRIVRVTVGQLVEIPFRGSGWVYLGELGSRRGIVYDSRRLDPEGQSFIFRAEAAGTYALKFYKQDFIRDYILNDYVQVIVGEAPESGAGWFKPPADRGRVTAEPRWPTVSEEAEARRQAGVSGAGPVPAEAAGGEPGPAAPAESPGGADSPAVSEGPGAADPPGPELRVPGITDEGIVSVVPPAAAGPPPVEEPRAGAEPPRQSPEEYLKKAREEFDAGRVASAISVLDQFREHFPSGSDEAWWLLGQFHEANSPSRDIRSALDYYRRLVREYPQSSRYNDARRRIAYLERFYINIQ